MCPSYAGIAKSTNVDTHFGGAPHKKAVEALKNAASGLAAWNTMTKKANDAVQESRHRGVKALFVLLYKLTNGGRAVLEYEGWEAALKDMGVSPACSRPAACMLPVCRPRCVRAPARPTPFTP